MVSEHMVNVDRSLQVQEVLSPMKNKENPEKQRMKIMKMTHPDLGRSASRKKNKKKIMSLVRLHKHRNLTTEEGDTFKGCFLGHSVP